MDCDKMDRFVNFSGFWAERTEEYGTASCTSLSSFRCEEFNATEWSESVMAFGLLTAVTVIAQQTLGGKCE
jgi:hypothetical protein